MGFFDLCRAHEEMNGRGVLIPTSNDRHLMLKQEVVDAVPAGKFRIYVVDTVDEGIEILTWRPRGRARSVRKFPEGSVNRRVQMRLIELSNKRLAMAEPQRCKCRVSYSDGATLRSERSAVTDFPMPRFHVRNFSVPGKG